MKFISLVILSLLFVGCAIGPTHGYLFTSNKFAGDYNRSNSVTGNKTAESCQHNILNLIAVGNSSVGDLAINSNIKKVATIDHSTLSILTLIYANHCTIITGD
ncbi:MAG: TRL-like family protein [Leptospira sp.]|nr:TRL-like family protein [Leptospira sp.]